MASTTRTVLLTGFGPFPGVPENATARLVPVLAERARATFPGVAIHTEIFDTTWTSAPQRAAALIAEHRPTLALHFGVAREARGFQIERQAQNLCRIDADAAGDLPLSAKLDHRGPDVRPAALDADAIAAHLAACGFPVSLSDDAGAYLCNAVLYHSLAAVEALSDAPGAACHSGFIHIPADLSRPPLPFPRAVDGALEIVRSCLGQIERIQKL